MSGLLLPAGVHLNFSGSMGNTLHAHRIIQYFQDPAQGGTETRTTQLIEGLYIRYFTQAKHPATDDTLIEACIDAGISEAEAMNAVSDRELGLKALKDKLRANGRDVDAVPVVMFEGKRRDLTLTGAKEVADYVKALNTIVKESA